MGITLVTGGTGYLGRHLIDSLLEDEVPVRALVYSEWKGEELAERGVEVIFGDVTDPETLDRSALASGVDTVFHLVGGGNDGRVNPHLINTEGTRNLVTAGWPAGEPAGLRALLYVSSSSVYGRSAGPVDEETPPAPRIDYSRSKLDAESLLLALAPRFPVMIARLAGIYGPAAPMLGTKLVRSGQMRITGDGQNSISIIHVEDAVQGLRAMAARGRPGRIYCLGDDEPLPLYLFHNHFAQLIDAPPVRTASLRKVQLMVRVVTFLARLVGRPSPLTQTLIEMSTLNVMMKNGRMRDELGVELRYPAYSEGLAHCAAMLAAEEKE
jgi:nucleoside-diphosphate-sugar epimerase